MLYQHFHFIMPDSSHIEASATRTEVMWVHISCETLFFVKSFSYNNVISLHNAHLHYSKFLLPFTKIPQSFISGGTVLWSKMRQKDKSKNIWLALISVNPVFIAFPVFLVPWLSPLLGFGVLTVFHQRGTRNTGYSWFSPCYSLVTWPHGCLSKHW